MNGSQAPVKDILLVQDVEVTIDMLEAEFVKFGALANGGRGVSIHTAKFNNQKTAQVGSCRCCYLRPSGGFLCLCRARGAAT